MIAFVIFLCSFRETFSDVMSSASRCVLISVKALPLNDLCLNKANASFCFELSRSMVCSIKKVVMLINLLMSVVTTTRIWLYFCIMISFIVGLQCYAMVTLL